MRVVLVSLLLLVVAPHPLRAEASPLDEARRRLAAGQLEALFETLDTHPFLEDEQPAAAELMADAAVLALDRSDATLALHFAQLALRTRKEHPRALEVAARACRVQQEFSAAERYADRWREAEPKSVDATLLRAEIAWDQGEWKRVLDLVKGIGRPSLSLLQKRRLVALQSSAEAELAERGVKRSSLGPAGARMETSSKKTPAQVGAADAKSPGDEVVLYGTSWCGYCRRTRDYLRRKGVAFKDLDIEANPSARAELARKGAAAGVDVSGVPVIDVKGTLVVGYDVAALDRLLR